MEDYVDRMEDGRLPAQLELNDEPQKREGAKVVRGENERAEKGCRPQFRIAVIGEVAKEDGVVPDQFEV